MIELKSLQKFRDEHGSLDDSKTEDGDNEKSPQELFSYTGVSKI